MGPLIKKKCNIYKSKNIKNKKTKKVMNFLWEIVLGLQIAEENFSSSFTSSFFLCILFQWEISLAASLPDKKDTPFIMWYCELYEIVKHAENYCKQTNKILLIFCHFLLCALSLFIAVVLSLFEVFAKILGEFLD